MNLEKQIEDIICKHGYNTGEQIKMLVELFKRENKDLLNQMAKLIDFSAEVVDTKTDWQKELAEDLKEQMVESNDNYAPGWGNK